MMSSSAIIYVLTQPKDHKNHHFCYCLDKNLDVLQTTVDHNVANKLTNKTFCLISDFTISRTDHSTYLKIHNNSKIFKTGSTFNIPEEVLNNFLTPKPTTVPEALASPPKRRLTITAKLSEVSPIKEGHNNLWKRKDITLTDEPTAKRIKCKLWNEHADSVTEANVGTMITITNVESELFKNQPQIKSIDLTSVSLNQPSSSKSLRNSDGSYTIIGIQDDEQNQNLSLITDNDQIFQVQQEVFDVLGYTLDDFVDLKPVQCTLTFSDGNVTDISIATNEQT